jgi:hypothetical protein
MDWGADYLQTVDWFQGANNGGALLIKGMSDICTSRPGGAALLTRVEEEGYLQSSYMLVSLKYYKNGTTNNVFSHIWHVYGEVTFGSQVRTWWRANDEDYAEDDACVMGVRNRVSDEIVCVRWREHIHLDNLHEIHMPEDGQQCLWKVG